MNWQSLSQEIWKWSGQLDFDLERIPNGAAWQKKLRTDRDRRTDFHNG